MFEATNQVCTREVIFFMMFGYVPLEKNYRATLAAFDERT